MALSIKVKGATPQSGKSLCLGCKMAQVIRGQNCEELVRCEMFAGSRYGSFVPFRIAECGAFTPSNMPWKHEMEQMAWRIEARRRGPSGFQPSEPIEVVVEPPSRTDMYPPPPQR